MKQISSLFVGACCVLCLFLSQSCVDNDYDWDDVNTEGRIVLPPVLIGNFEPIIVKEQVQLPDIPEIDDLPALDFAEAYEYVFEDIFDEDLIDFFFYEGNSVSLSGLADVVVLDKNSELKLTIVFKVLDEDRNIIDEVKIPNQVLTYGKAQPIEVLIESEYMEYFESRSARHLHADLIVTAKNAEEIKETDYIEIKKVVMKSNALKFDL